MNEPEWLHRKHIIYDLESFLDQVPPDPKLNVSDIETIMAEGLLMLLREQHEHDPDVPQNHR